MNKLLIAAATAALALGSAANADTITFDGLPTSGATNYSYTDGAFDVSLGGLYYDSSEGEIEPLCCDSSGMLTVTRNGGGLFNFVSIDHQLEYAQWSSFTLKGYVGASLVFSQSGASTNGSYATYLSTDLSAIDKLEVTGTRDFAGGVSLDNLVLETARAVPEPATWGMMIGGLALTGAAMRRRKAAVAFA